jgi:hypothetical protein
MVTDILMILYPLEWLKNPRLILTVAIGLMKIQTEMGMIIFGQVLLCHLLEYLKDHLYLQTLVRLGGKNTNQSMEIL